MQYPEGFQYSKSLDINVGCYNIRISPASQYMTKIITEFGKFRYNRLPMGMCASWNIFQAKVDELHVDIMGVKTYIDGALVFSKYSFENHIDQRRIIFVRLRAAGLKFNSPKCSFGLKEIPYLGYVITREGIKPDPIKVQGIMNIGWPYTTTEVWAIIVMVQY